jgi:hypothetical protein
MKLNTLERLTAFELLPKEGSFTNLKLIREAKEVLSFTDKEHKRLKFKQLPGGSVQWDTQDPKVDSVEIKLGEVATGLIKKALENLDKAEKLEERHFSLYEKFVEGK